MELQGEVRALEGLLSICPDCYEAEVRPDLERLKRAARSRPGPDGG